MDESSEEGSAAAASEINPCEVESSEAESTREERQEAKLRAGIWSAVMTIGLMQAKNRLIVETKATKPPN